MHKYSEIVRIARKNGIQLQYSTLRKEFSKAKIKPEQIIMGFAYFSDEDVNEYFKRKKLIMGKPNRGRGKPNKPFNLNGVRYESVTDCEERTETPRSTIEYWIKIGKAVKY